MKLLVLFGACCLWLAPASKKNTPKVYALVVGVSNYYDPVITGLKYADKDALSFAEFLRSANAGALSRENMVVLTNGQATRKAIIDSLVGLLARVDREDLVIFYFAGHATYEVAENAGYLLSYDAQKGSEQSSAVSMDEVRKKIERCKAKMKLSYVDACYAASYMEEGTRGDGFDNGDIIKAYTAELTNASEGNAAILSCTKGQTSREDSKLGHGIFTYYLLQGLKGQADKAQADAGKTYDNGIVSIGELKTFLTENIGKATGYKQTPTYSGLYDEDFPLSVLLPGITLTNEISKRPRKVMEKPVAENPSKVIEYIAAKENKSLQNGSFSHAETFGRVTFINEMGFTLRLYYGISPDGMSSSVTPLTIAPNSTGKTNPLSVGYADSGHMPQDKSYLFYFYGKDASGTLVFGGVTVMVEAMHEYTMRLTKDNLTMATDGTKDKGELTRLGMVVNQ